ncbi:MAG: 2-amino-4-hydroxy-6-hydroxymethyldihydropteridine diphosphokinase [Spirochaetales bacterium]|nr:2-amino-4-hydroxy-6-hydroxymethyldihydropteridine diphosphokinase [Spirochaetales bacterium]
MPEVYIGVGSNINPEKNIPSALGLLKKETEICSTSTFYYTKALNNKDQADYCNGVWKISTSLPAYDLKFYVLREIESTLGRSRSKDPYASRPIDLDILLYGKEIINTDDLTIPDPDIYTRPFISIPLLEIAPDLMIPDTGEKVETIVIRMKDVQMKPAHRITNKIKKGIKNG